MFKSELLLNTKNKNNNFNYVKILPKLNDMITVKNNPFNSQNWENVAFKALMLKYLY